MTELWITCHCGTAAQTVRLGGPVPQDVDICHCDDCRHNTGVLCTSYVAIEKPVRVEGLVAYTAKRSEGREEPGGVEEKGGERDGLTRWFCGRCGCHVFSKGDGNGEGWEVATGVVVGDDAENCEETEVEEGEEKETGSREQLWRYVRHVNTDGTKDGGLSPFIRDIGGRSLEVHGGLDAPLRSGISTALDTAIEEVVLNGYCHCRNVRFQITRPNAASTVPRSGFPDLMAPYYTGSEEIRNPQDVKWWLHPTVGANIRKEDTDGRDGRTTRYMGGTCACRSCRLISGFEIQTWAFVPKANIFFHVPSSANGKDTTAATTTTTMPLEFDTLPEGILSSYESKAGVHREFCAKCGATVFWRDRLRSELMDVSVGLLDAQEGAKAESWLDWWRNRVSFEEEAGTERTGEVKKTAVELVSSLARGLREVA
ncbi:hypothetical protein F5Y18DRAFT_125735 [Xylariaceae sp. FL1019]|nr:hypothetical protein F5Y18DRAFT_125735 [Xylariaceae sp. FL1019]